MATDNNDIWAHVPKREQLLAQLQQANQFTWAWLLIRLVAIAALAALISWREVAFAPIVSVTACLAIIGPFMMDVARIWGQRKKKLDDVKESTRFGELDKHQLRSLYRDVLNKLRLPSDEVPVYITADKSLNASAVRLGKLFGGVNGIYLHRQVLHRLNGAEVQSIIGHELGHYYRFRLAGDRFRLLTLVLGALLGIFAVQTIQMSGFLGFILLSVISSAFWYISGIGHLRHGTAIEYLCDDFGGQVNGVEASINALLKVGVDSESRFLIQLELLARHANNELLSSQEIDQAIEKATPYGNAEQSEIYEAIRQEISNKLRSNRQASISGFIKYMWDSDDEEDDAEEFKEELQRQARAVNQIQRLDWESLLDNPAEINLGPSQIEALVSMLVASPEKSLFQIPASVSFDGIHPPLESRILYLWANRNSAAAL